MGTIQVNVDRELAKKVLEVVDHGLVNGIGRAIPGHMCVEAAVCYAMDLPHSDNPPCVGKAVRAAKIILNDSPWSGDRARAQGMRRVAIAQLGSDQIDQVEFVRLLQEGYAAFQQKHPPRDDARAADYTARAADYTARAAESAAEAADYTAWAAHYTAEAAGCTAMAAECAAWAAKYTAMAVASTAKAAENTDEALSSFARIIEGALIKCDSPGCQWLDLADRNNSRRPIV